ILTFASAASAAAARGSAPRFETPSEKIKIAAGGSSLTDGGGAGGPGAGVGAGAGTRGPSCGTGPGGPPQPLQPVPQEFLPQRQDAQRLQDGGADGGSLLRLQPVQRLIQCLPVGGRGHKYGTVIAEGDQSDAGAGGHRLDEIARRVLGRRQPVRLYGSRDHALPGV